ncbi:sulfopyruvate decarboxylase subunit alpha [Methanococcus voltae]|uniref:sulfopyruvate decarboxylase n=1 Tax=Methanococcus voltae (strain ATCC BAA-1334 / A3) TaxID=456320 RepID=D7DR26_METV3|nr:sulfopyruvate decarboxylase subunit alpha [Methanococcus voltae]MCS3900963.1 sulfopyruvate decarboxylase subunit alpha [Methanococcus voltae]
MNQTDKNNLKVSNAVFEAIKDSNIDFIVSVPCVNLKNLIIMIENEIETNLNQNNPKVDFEEQRNKLIHIPITREEEGIGICAGAHLSGRKTALLMQNSGLGNSINAIGSLLKVYKIPLVMIISHRGDLKEKIAAQIPMGQWTKKLLEVAEIPYYCPETPEEAEKVIKYATEMSETMKYPVAVLLDALYWEND